MNEKNLIEDVFDEESFINNILLDLVNFSKENDVNIYIKIENENKKDNLKLNYDYYY